MKLFKIFIPLFIFVFALNLYAQDDFFGSMAGTKYYNGMLVETKEGGTVLAIENPWVKHIELAQSIEKQHGKITKMLWAGEVEAIVGTDGAVSVTRVNETAGMIENYADYKGADPDDPLSNFGKIPIPGEVSTKELYENPGLGKENLKKYIDTNPNIKDKYFKTTDYIAYDEGNKHLDESLIEIAKIRHGLFSSLNTFVVFSTYPAKVDVNKGISSAKEVLSMYETMIKYNPSYYVKEWEDIKPLLELISNAKSIEGIDLSKTPGLAMAFKKTLAELLLQNNYVFFVFPTSTTTMSALDETFAKTLDDKRLAIFKDRILAEHKERKELAADLGMSDATLRRWEEKIRQDYDNYLETGQVPNKYLLLDTKTLVDFANSELKTPEEQYLLAFRIANSKPKTLEQVEKMIKIPTTTIARREVSITEKLDRYLDLIKVLGSKTLGQEEFDILFKTDIIANLLESYKKTKSPLDALRLLMIEKIRRQYVSYSNTPTGTSPTATDLALRDEITKMDLGGLDQEYSSVEELKKIVEKIEIDKLDLKTDEAKELKETYETKIELEKIEVK